MATPAVLRIDIQADASKAQRALGQVQKSAGGVPGWADKASTGVLAVGAALVPLGAMAVNAASDLDETMNKVNVVFGDSAAEVTAWSENAATAFGMSQEQALGAASTFGDMFSQLGQTTDEAAANSQAMIGLAADLGSFHNVDPSDVLERIGGAFRGEFDSIQKLVPNLNAARVETEALKMTGKESADQLTANEKVLATQAILMSDSANAANDFAETSGSLANQQRTMAAQTKDLGAAFGTALLPAVSSVMGALSGLVPLIQAAAEFFSRNIEWIGPLVGILVGLALAVKLVAVAQGIWNAVMALSPLTWIVVGIVALIAAIVLLIKNWDKIVAATKKAWAAIVGAITRAFDTVKTVVLKVWNAVSSAVSGIITGIKEKWSAVVAWFTGLKDQVLGFFVNALNWLLSAGRNIVTGLFDGLKAVWSNVADWLGGFVGRVVGFYANAGRWLYDVGKKIIQGLWDGLKDMWKNVTGWFSGLADQIADLKGPPARDARILVGAGRLIMGGLQTGLTEGWGGVASYLSSRQFNVGGAGGLAAGRGGGAGGTYTLNLSTRTADPRDVANGFRRLELARAYRGG